MSEAMLDIQSAQICFISSVKERRVPAAGLLAADSLMSDWLLWITCTVFHCHTDLHHSNTMHSLTKTTLTVTEAASRSVF